MPPFDAPPVISKEGPVYSARPALTGAPFPLKECCHTIALHNPREISANIMFEFYQTGSRTVNPAGYLRNLGVYAEAIPVYFKGLHIIDEFIIKSKKYIEDKKAEQEELARREAIAAQKRAVAT